MRWQSSTTGGWIQRDTLDAPLDPKNANRYAFAGADPVNASDPTGQAWVGPSFQARYIICGGIGVSFNDKGIGVTGSVSGGPAIGLTGSVEAGPGGNTKGLSNYTNCSATAGGGVSISSTGGNFSGGPAVGSGIGCSTGVQYQQQFNIG